jgi:tetratricopeptide (TPR) repeat protein
MMNVERTGLPVTDGEIAVNNLESARRHAWDKFCREPQRLDIAEYIVELEGFAAQFRDDLEALDRLAELARNVDHVETDSGRAALIRAQVASSLHCFAEARAYLAKRTFAAPLDIVAHRLSLSIDQACGDHLEVVLESRRQMAEESGRLEDMVPLGALLADLGCFDEADRIYDRGLQEYHDVSPFAVAWVCFQRGVLWGELVPEAQPSRAAHWYRRAIEYLPCYVKARVHLSEIYLSAGDTLAAESLLAPVISSGDPEVYWRLADVWTAMDRKAEAEDQMEGARSGFEALLSKHLLAFADHGSEFYSGSGNDSRRAFELAMINLANRPTLRAFERAYETAIETREVEASYEIAAQARKHCGGTVAFRISPLANSVGAEREGETG